MGKDLITYGSFRIPLKSSVSSGFFLSFKDQIHFLARHSVLSCKKTTLDFTLKVIHFGHILTSIFPLNVPIHIKNWIFLWYTLKLFLIKKTFSNIGMKFIFSLYEPLSHKFLKPMRWIDELNFHICWRQL